MDIFSDFGIFEHSIQWQSLISYVHTTFKRIKQPVHFWIKIQQNNYRLSSKNFLFKITV